MCLSHSFKFSSLAFFLFSAIFAPSPASAAILFESGTLGDTGFTSGDLTDGDPPGTSVSNSVYIAVIFQLDQPVVTSQIGGHFVAPVSGTFFGAIVALDDENDVPDSFNFSTPDFVGSTLLDFPTSSGEIFGNLTLSLESGWYALVFGSGLFGATGDGATVRNGTDIGFPTYIAGRPFPGDEWFDITSRFPNHRFVIQGLIVPEASTIVLASIASLIFLVRKSFNKT